MRLTYYCAIVFPLHYHSRAKSARFIWLVALPWLSGFAYHQYLACFIKVEQRASASCFVPRAVHREPVSHSEGRFWSSSSWLVMVCVYTAISIKLKNMTTERFQKDIGKPSGSRVSVDFNLATPVSTTVAVPEGMSSRWC